jgi:flagellar hook-associated protein 3 FlgL
MIDEMIDLGNSHQAGVAIFGGRHTDQNPFAVQRNAQGQVAAVSLNANGTEGAMIRKVGEDVSLTINQTATDVFGNGGAVFKTLIQLRDALNTGDGDKIRSLGAKLDGDLDHVVQAQATVGSLIGRTDALLKRVQDDTTTFEAGRSRAEDLDTAKAIVDFQQEQMTLQSALTSGSRILGSSLMDYLK